MSPRAACRLETLGFIEVYDYVPGKADWLAHGLPREGADAATPVLGDVLRHDVVTCRLADTVGAIRALVGDSPYGFGLVLSNTEVVLGRVRASVLRAHSDTAAIEACLEPGPSTVRPDTALQKAAETMRQHNLTVMIVTTPEGQLLGVARRADVDGQDGG